MATTSGQGRTLRPTNCHFCGYLCAFTATVEDGKVVDLEPDTTRYPYDSSITAGCRRWRENIRFLNDPTRIDHPLHRLGGRGCGEWERVSWDEALSDIAKRMEELIGRYGPWTIASAIGGPHATFWPLHRFMNLVGSPNNMGIGQICWNPRIWMDVLTFGWTIEPDIREGLTETLIIWGTNPSQSDNSLFWRELIRLSKTDMEIIAIDPRFTQTARIADRWIAIKPGTDGALALGMAHIILAEGLEDRGFVERWCSGLDEFEKAVEPYDAMTVSRICDIPADDVIYLARTYAGAHRACIVSGRGIDQAGIHVAPTHRAIACLRAITGNIDEPGSSTISMASDFTPEVDLEMGEELTDEQRAHCLNTPYTPLQCYDGYGKVRKLTGRFGRVLPQRYLTSAHPSLVWKAMTTGEPYPIRALIVQATNPLLTYADTHLVFEALDSLDLLVVLEYHLTPTAMMADYVLPIASAMERPLFQIHGGVANVGYGGPAAVRPAHERRTDYEVIRGLGLELGQKDAWPDETLEEAYDRQLRAAGLTWERFCETGLYYVPDRYRKHEELDPATGRPRGFSTTSGKVELASELLSALGGPRVPAFETSKASLSDATLKKGTPLIALTGSRKQPYNASDFHDIESFQAIYPRALACLSEATARRCGLAEGDPVIVRTDRGEATFTLHISAMRDDIIDIDYGWWYPKRAGHTPDLAGIWESNVNTITSGDVGSGEPMIGTWWYNAFPCVISKG